MVCCCIIGCTSKDTQGAKLFRIPSLPTVSLGAYVESSVERNKLWLKVINNPDVTETTYPKHRVCQKHFIKGKPARVQDRDDPDWIPSINLIFKTVTPSPTKKQTKDSQRLKRKLDRSNKTESSTDSPKKIKDETNIEEEVVVSELEPKPQRVEIQKVEELPKFVSNIELEQEPIEYFEPFKESNTLVDIPVGGEIEVELPKEIHDQHLPVVEQTIVVETTHREEVVEYTPRKDSTRLELEISKRKIRELQKELDNKQTEILRKNIEILNLKRKLSLSQQEVINLQNSITIQEQQEEVIVEEEEDEAESAVVSDINSYTTVAGKKLYYVVVNKDRFLQIPLPEGNSL